MTSANWQQVKEIFQAAIELNPNGERASYLNSQCGANEDLRCEVESLLKSHESATADFIERPPYLTDDSSRFSEQNDSIQIWDKIGQYEILREIGRGGMGTVYLAARTSDFLKRVAFKVIKRGMDTDFILRRFLNERQILAALEHPFIARLLDGGATDDGRPYLVMEYVEGVPITEFCRERNYDLKQRLELFCKICEAVSFAHQNLIVHRDLKPSNILITADGTPKLLDFGIAKLLNSDNSIDSPTTAAVRILTPDYASPEQIKGAPIATTSDVYSLGVLLYELLTGNRPFQFRDNSPAEIFKLICETSPEKPSAFLSSKFKVQSSKLENQTSPNNIKQLTNTEQNGNPKSKIQNLKSLKGDLDNIVLKSLEKEPARRYATVEAFAQDIWFYLAGKPVMAHSATFAYRAEKFVRRHAKALAIAAIISIALISLTFTSISRSIAAQRAEERANRRFEEVRKLAHSTIYDYPDGIAKLPGSIEMRERLIRDGTEYLDTLAQESDADLNLQRELAQAYRRVGELQSGGAGGSIGDSNAALVSHQKSLTIAERIAANPAATDDDYLFLADGKNKLTEMQANLSLLADDVTPKKEVLAILENLRARHTGEPKYESYLGRSYWSLAKSEQIGGDFAAAITHFRQAALIFDNLVQADQANQKYKHNLAGVYEFLSRAMFDEMKPENFPEALDYAQRDLTINEQRAQQLPDDISVKDDLASAYVAVAWGFLVSGNIDNALINYHKALELTTELLNSDPKNTKYHTDLSMIYYWMGDVYNKKGETQNAIDAYTKGLNLIQDQDQSNFYNMTSVAQFYQSIGSDYLALAERSPVNTARRENLLTAHNWLEKSVNAWHQLENRSALPPYFTEAKQKAEQELINCNSKLN